MNDAIEMSIIITVFFFSILIILASSDFFVVEVNTRYNDIFPEIAIENAIIDASHGIFDKKLHAGTEYEVFNDFIITENAIKSEEKTAGELPEQWEKKDYANDVLMYDGKMHSVGIISHAMRSEMFSNVFRAWFTGREEIIKCKSECMVSFKSQGLFECMKYENRGEVEICAPSVLDIEDYSVMLKKGQTLFAKRKGREIEFEVVE